LLETLDDHVTLVRARAWMTPVTVPSIALSMRMARPSAFSVP
jgi:hypothetical protein